MQWKITVFRTGQGFLTFQVVGADVQQAIFNAQNQNLQIYEIIAIELAEIEG